MRVRFTRHALEHLQSRNLSRDVIVRAIQSPIWTEVDPADETLTRFYAFSDEERSSVIRVVARDINSEELLVITALIDRNARDKLLK